jgi:hypothetical protein
MISLRPAPRKLVFLEYYSRATQSNDWKVKNCSEPLRIPRNADFANLQNLLRARVATLQVCRCIYYNKLKLGGPRFRERDLVYLLRQNIKTIRLSNKLDYKKFDLFKVKRNIKDISYKFHFSFIMRIYPVFYISLLEPADLDTPIGLALEIYLNLQKEVYTVKKIWKIRKYRKIL